MNDESSANSRARRVSQPLTPKDLVFVAFACLLIAAAMYALWWRSSGDPTGPYSGLDREQLVLVSGGTEPLVPLKLPPGLAADADPSDFVGSYQVGDRTYAGDQLPFYLQRVIAAPDLPVERREIVVVYLSVVLGESEEARFEVHQLPEGMSTKIPCTAWGSPHIEREVGTTRLVICSPSLREGTVAWEYWRSVRFTSQLEKVEWLRGDT